VYTGQIMRLAVCGFETRVLNPSNCLLNCSVKHRTRP